MRRQIARSSALIAMLVLSGCSAGSAGSPAHDEPPTTGSAVDAAASLITERYEMVRDGDFEGACDLYSADFTELFIELVGTDAANCVEAHQEATSGVDDAREFEDGSAKTPGWLAGQQYVKRGSDGQWRFVAMTEQ